MWAIVGREHKDKREIYRTESRQTKKRRKKDDNDNEDDDESTKKGNQIMNCRHDWFSGGVGMWAMADDQNGTIKIGYPW